MGRTWVLCVMSVLMQPSLICSLRECNHCVGHDIGVCSSCVKWAHFHLVHQICMGHD